MTDRLSQEGHDAHAREAFVAIEAVLEQRCPEMKVAFWKAVDMLYGLDAASSRALKAAPGPNPDVQASAQAQPELP